MLIEVTEELCMTCWCKRPTVGWWRTDDGDDAQEFFCSEECYAETQPLDYEEASMPDPEVEGLKTEIARLRAENSALLGNNRFLLEQIRAAQEWHRNSPNWLHENQQERQ